MQKQNYEKIEKELEGKYKKRDKKKKKKMKVDSSNVKEIASLHLRD